MTLMFAMGVGVCYWAEAKGNPNVARLGVMTVASDDQPGGNMEGKETRFGIAASALFATVTTDASCGAVNSMHDSYTPIGGAVPLVNLMCDETIFGGVGAGLYGMLMYAVIAVFIAGLMVGRTPEYIGKKIEKFEVRMAILAVLILFANVVLHRAGGNANCRRAGLVTITDANKRRGCLAHRQPGTTSTTPARACSRAPPTTTSTTPARTGSRRYSTPTPRRRATTARLSPASRPTRRTTT